MSRILIAEDSPTIRLLLRRRLEMAGHQVTEARDGVEAVEAAAGGSSDKPDLVLLDEMMPNMDGNEALRLLKSRTPEMPVLMVSALSGPDDCEDWALADGHMGKPIDFGELLARIDLLTAGPPRPGSRNP
jgi:two-component system response regulator RpaA